MLTAQYFGSASYLILGVKPRNCQRHEPKRSQPWILAIEKVGGQMQYPEIGFIIIIIIIFACYKCFSCLNYCLFKFCTLVSHLGPYWGENVVINYLNKILRTLNFHRQRMHHFCLFCSILSLGLVLYICRDIAKMKKTSLTIMGLKSVVIYRVA